MVDAISLPCLHRYCLRCVDLLYRSTEDASSGFACHVCKEAVKPTETWKRDPLVDAMVRSYLQHAERMPQGDMVRNYMVEGDPSSTGTTFKPRSTCPRRWQSICPIHRMMQTRYPNPC